MTKKIPIIGIATGALYFISVGLFLITKTEVALSVWELMTIFSAPVVLFVLLELSTLLGVTSIYRNGYRLPGMGFFHGACIFVHKLRR